MQATIYNLEGQSAGSIELNDAVFGIEPNIPVVHQAVLRQQANARLGTHNTKTRAYVSGGGAKPWRQKGTGRARQGSTRSPQFRHGGVVFGPHPRSYAQDLPRKMRRLAMRSVLSAKAQAGQILFIESFDTLEPRTKSMITLLGRLNVSNSKVLIMTPTREANVEQAAGNIKTVKTMMAGYLNLVDMLNAEVLVINRAGVELIEGILGQTGGRSSHEIDAPETPAATTVGSPLGEAATAAAPAALLPAAGEAADEQDANTVTFTPSSEATTETEPTGTEEA